MLNCDSCYHTIETDSKHVCNSWYRHYRTRMVGLCSDGHFDSTRIKYLRMTARNK